MPRSFILKKAMIRKALRAGDKTRQKTDGKESKSLKGIRYIKEFDDCGYGFFRESDNNRKNHSGGFSKK